jgi:hypothetical protein
MSTKDEEITFCEFITKPEGRSILKIILSFIVIFILFFLLVVLSNNSDLIFLLIKVVCLVFFYVFVTYVIIWYRRRKNTQGEGLICKNREGREIIFTFEKEPYVGKITKKEGIIEKKSIKSVKVIKGKTEPPVVNYNIDLFQNANICHALSAIGVFSSFDFFNKNIEQLIGGQIDKKIKSTYIFFDYIGKQFALSKNEVYSKFVKLCKALGKKDIVITLSLLFFIIKEDYYHNSKENREIFEKIILNNESFENIKDILLYSLNIIPWKSKQISENVRKAIKFFPTIIQLSSECQITCGIVFVDINLINVFLTESYSVNKILKVNNPETITKQKQENINLAVIHEYTLPKTKFLSGESTFKNFLEEFKEETKKEVKNSLYYIFEFQSFQGSEQEEQLLRLSNIKLKIIQEGFSLKAFIIRTVGHFVCFVIKSLEGNKLTLVVFDNLKEGNISKITVESKGFIEKEIFQSLSEKGFSYDIEKYFLLVTVFQRTEQKQPEIKVFKEKTDLKHFIEDNPFKELVPKYFRREEILKLIGFLIKDIGKRENDYLQFVKIILFLLTIRTSLIRRLYILTVHIKFLKEKIKIKNKIFIEDVKTYSIYEKINDLKNIKPRTNYENSLFDYTMEELLYEKLKDFNGKSQEDLVNHIKGNTDKSTENLENFLKSMADNVLGRFKNYESLYIFEIFDILDEFLWKPVDIEEDKPVFYPTIILNYYQKRKIIIEIINLLEIFDIFNKILKPFHQKTSTSTEVVKEEEIKQIIGDLSIRIRNLCASILECQVTNLYTISVFKTKSVELKQKTFEEKEEQITDEYIKTLYGYIKRNISLSHYALVSRMLIEKDLLLEEFKKTGFSFFTATEESNIKTFAQKLCSNEEYVKTFYEKVSEILADYKQKEQKKEIEKIKERLIIIPKGEIKPPLEQEQKTSTKVSEPQNNVSNLDNIQIKELAKKQGKILKLELDKKTFSVVIGNIEEVNYAEAVVNAANNKLASGGGITGAIFRTSGISSELEQENSIPNGLAVVSESFNFKKKGVNFIIHAVGPNLGKIEKNQAFNFSSEVSLIQISYAVLNALNIKNLVKEIKDGTLKQEQKNIKEDLSKLKRIVIPLISGELYAGQFNVFPEANFIILMNLSAIFYTLKDNENDISEINLIIYQGLKVGQKEKILSCIKTLSKVVLPKDVKIFTQ